MSVMTLGRTRTPAVLVCGLLLYVQSCSPGYLLHLCIGQLRILAGRRPIQEVLRDPAVGEHIKDKLRLILEAKEYAETHIGLARSDNYTDYYEATGPALAYVLSAAPALELRAYTWCFPIAGCLPYKGFFSCDRATKEKKRLEAKGFDTNLRQVSAYSTLGWFRDPIVSHMLADNPAYLVETVIHEMVHRTVFVRHKVEFNEGLATFVGQRGALEFLERRFGPTSAISVWARHRREDEAVFQQFLIHMKDRLTALYELSIPEQEKREKKQMLFQEAKQEYRLLLERFKTKGFEWLLHKEWNNALVVSYLTYMKDLSLYERLYEKLGHDLKAVIAYCKSLETSDDPERSVREFVSETPLADMTVSLTTMTGRHIVVKN